jgi:heme-degrading monooxygenase HmoA
MAYIIIWEFHVASTDVAAFEEAYNPDGTWSSLFAKADGFIDVELLRSAEEDGRYLTIDRWASMRAFDSFKSAFEGEYAALDEKLQGITGSEKRLGAFET